MNAFISVDLEGMPHVVVPGHLNLKGSLYEEARRIATRVTLIVADELKKNDFDRVVIADSHGPMVNILIDDLPEYVDIVRGYPRPLSQIAGAEECDVALLIGYHAKFGTPKSSFDHTYAGSSINKLEINAIAASEFLLNTYALGELNVPVILVAGEAQLIKDDVQKYAPWAETATFKDSLSRVSAKSPSLAKIEKELRKTVTRAVSNYRHGSSETLLATKPVKIGVTFLASQFADVAALLPSVNRINGLKIEYIVDNVIDAYKTFELLVLAAAGMTALYESHR